MVHRDLTPDNVLLGPDGPRVIGFGMARAPELSLTATGLRACTPAYTPPEVFTGGRVGATADVFAWGGIVLYAATSEEPFAAESLGAVMHRVLSVNPDLSPLPGPLRTPIAAALAKDPHARPTARELLIALINRGGDGDRERDGAGLVTARLDRAGLDGAGLTAVRFDTAELLTIGGDVGARFHTASDDPGLGALAEDAYGALDPVECELVLDVFLRFVAISADGQAVARRTEVPTGSERILEIFARFVTREGGEVGLAHPALPYAWPRLRGWIDANHDLLVARDKPTRRAPLLLAALAVFVLVAGMLVVKMLV